MATTWTGGKVTRVPVVKTTDSNGNPVAKLSDSQGKTMCCDEEYVKYLRSAVEFRLKREGMK